MESIRQRARDKLPSVLLTLLSIVQAIALETLWNHAVQRTDLFEPGWDAAFGWLQVATTLLLIIMIWLVYVSLVMRFRWTPTIGDLTLPFGVGIVELLLIEVMGPARPHAWFVVLAMVFALVYWFLQHIFQRARPDPENAEFFSQVGAASWRDHLSSALVILLLLGFGVWLWLAEPQKWLLLAGALTALAITGYQIHLVGNYWRTSMGNSPG